MTFLFNSDFLYIFFELLTAAGRDLFLEPFGGFFQRHAA